MKRKPTGELNVFKELCEERIHKDFVRGNKIVPITVSNMAHVLSKNQYPKFRLFKKNIQFLQKDQHRQWDTARFEIEEHPFWQKMFELEQALKQDYADLERGAISMEQLEDDWEFDEQYWL